MGCFPHYPQIKRLSNTLIQQQYNLKITANPSQTIFSTSCGINTEKIISNDQILPALVKKQSEEVNLDYFNESMLSRKVRKPTIRQTFSITIPEDENNNQPKLKPYNSPVFEEEVRYVYQSQKRQASKKELAEVANENCQSDMSSTEEIEHAYSQYTNFMSSNVNYFPDQEEALESFSQKSIKRNGKIQLQKQNIIKTTPSGLPKLTRGLESRTQHCIISSKQAQQTNLSQNTLKFSSQKCLAQLEIAQLKPSAKNKAK